MRLYIPEIGDQFRLLRDWNFVLHNESRNSELWAALDCANHPSLAEQRAQIAAHEAEQAEIDARTRPAARPRWPGEREYARPGDLDRWRELRDEIYRLQQSTCPVTLPEGTVLSVDRIYIRKGASDFSSISFYIQSTSVAELQPSALTTRGFKKGKKRFWAKLCDVNEIEMQPVARDGDGG